MQLPGVSIVIPTFNRAGPVVRAIDSVLQQTYPRDCVDVVVVNDGSTDGTGDLLSARYGSRIRRLVQCNAGPAAARNRGIDAAKHELVAFLDSDDRWLPTKLEQQIPSLGRPDVVLSYSNWIQGGRSKGIDRFREIGVELDVPVALVENPLQVLLRPGGSGVWTSTCVVRKGALLRCGGFDERMKLCEDIRLWFRLAFEGCFAALRDPLVERGEEGGDNLSKVVDPMADLAYARESARLRLEVFWETYARAADAPRVVQSRLRRFIATSLYEQSVCSALGCDYRVSRRKAIEALAFGPGGLELVGSVSSACAPSLVARLHRWRHGLRRARTRRAAERTRP